MSRQADRIRRRSHTSDWPGAASAMRELEETVVLLSRLVNGALEFSLTPVESDRDVDVESGPVLSVGQYL